MNHNIKIDLKARVSEINESNPYRLDESTIFENIILNLGHNLT